MLPLKAVLGQARTRVVAAMFTAILLVLAGLNALGLLTRLDNIALDATQRLVRSLSPRSAVGIAGSDKDFARAVWDACKARIR